MEQEVPSVGVRKVRVGEAAAQSSGEGSVVVQCTSGGGEEVVRGEAVPGAGGESQYGSLQTYSKVARRVLGGEAEEVVSESEDASLHGGGIEVGDESGYWSSRVRTRRSSGLKSSDETLPVDSAPVKRKYEDVNECGPLSGSMLYEDTDSDDSASSSDSDASDSEYEHWSRRATSSKRRRGGEDTYGSILMTDECLHLESQQEIVNFDNELKEMQQLLELQLQASERREAGMKQRMETMMEMMSKHMGHVEKRVCNLEVGAEPHDQILERINLKLEKVMDGFTTLNENLSILSACLSKEFDSQ
ncbi:hypothetical protein M758_10G146800 [Ceratodon purpureus]|nr:hypothetical protein M758_10G146800 [Ceratodon purpureus]